VGHRWRRRLGPALVRIILLGTLVFLGAEAGARPNLVLIVLDDLGVDRVAAYRPETAGPTPQLDALAAEGVRFTRFWGMPNCSPFRASALTGLPVRGHQVGGPIELSNPRRSRGLDPTLETLPRRLHPLGYRSEAIGKWHLAGQPGYTPKHPLLAGFDHHRGTMGNPGSYSRYEKCIDGVCEPVDDRYLTSDTTDDAIAALGGSEPFFLWVAYNAAHKPLHPVPTSLHSYGELPCPDWDHAVCHKALVESLDTEVGRLAAAVDWSDTTVIVVADNGTPNTSQDSDSATAGKGTVYDAGLLVPLIVRGSAVAPAARGESTPAMGQTTDLFATLLELAGEPSETAETDFSRSLATQLLDPTAPPRRPWQYVERYAPNGPKPDPALRHHEVAANERYKLVIRRPRPTGEFELYDRFEHRDRVDLYPPGDDAERRAAFAELRMVLERHGSIPRDWQAPRVQTSGSSQTQQTRETGETESSGGNYRWLLVAVPLGAILGWIAGRAVRARGLWPRPRR